MHFVYILYSAVKQKYYVGCTASIDDRVIKHNNKHKGFTAGSNDWKVAYTEQFETKAEALKREKQIKSWKSRLLIEDLIRKSSLPEVFDFILIN